MQNRERHEGQKLTSKAIYAVGEANKNVNAEKRNYSAASYARYIGWIGISQVYSGFAVKDINIILPISPAWKMRAIYHEDGWASCEISR